MQHGYVHNFMHFFHVWVKFITKLTIKSSFGRFQHIDAGLALQYQAMEYPAGAVSLLLINLIVSLAVSLPMVQVVGHMVQAGLMVIVGQGIAYLSYPVIGWVTDVFLTRHAVLKCSLILLTTMAGLSLFISSTLEITF